jgi:ribosome-associated protein
MAAVEVLPGLEIPQEELRFAFSRSPGPGGQHANTSDTRVELRFDVRASTALSDEQKTLVLERLANRITREGVLLLTCNEHRSQARNREVVVARFVMLLAEALRVERPRKRTRPARSVNLRRLETKRHQALKKALRRPLDPP